VILRAFPSQRLRGLVSGAQRDDGRAVLVLVDGYHYPAVAIAAESVAWAGLVVAQAVLGRLRGEAKYDGVGGHSDSLSALPDAMARTECSQGGRRSYVGRPECSALSREGHFAGAAERLPEPAKHHKIDVERDSLKPAHAERRESVAVLQVSEGPFHRRAAAVQITEALSVARDGYTARMPSNPSVVITMMATSSGQVARRNPANALTLEAYAASGMARARPSACPSPASVLR
jgi:hypothetical protein